MNSEQSTLRVAGILLLLTFLAFILHQAMYMVMDPAAGPGPISSITQDLYSYLICFAGLAWYMALRKRNAVLAMFGGFGLVSHGLFVFLQTAIIDAGMAFPEDFSWIGPDADPSAGATGVLDKVAENIGRYGYTMFGLGVLSMSALILKTGVAARWIAWLGVVAGIILLFSFTVGFDLVMARNSYITYPFVMLSPVFFILFIGLKLFAISRDQQEVA